MSSEESPGQPIDGGGIRGGISGVEDVHILSHVNDLQW